MSADGLILVTGAGGWLGSALIDRLRDARPGVGLQGLTRADVDLADELRVDEVLRDLRPETVVHLAASLARGPDAYSVAAQWRDTFWCGRNVVRAAARAGARHLVVAGSLEELGCQEGVMTTDLGADAVTTYGLCKSLVREVASFEARTTPFRVDWFRPTTVYGPGQRGTMVVPYAFESARNGRPAEFTDGSQLRDFLFVDDLLDWLTLAADERVTRGGEPGLHVHHLGTGIGVAVRDVLDAIAKENPGAEFHLGRRPRRPNEPCVQVAPPYRQPDPVLAGWKPKVGWQDGIRRTASWWCRQSA